MLFGKPQNDRNTACCPECTWSAPLHHPCCPNQTESTALVDPFEDYRHLVGPPAMHQYKPWKDPGFDGLLDDDDRILLRGMRISWQA